MGKNKPKLVVILGPTSSGKSDLAVLIAKKFNGEVVSADSRQVYTGANIGSGKVTKQEMAGIPHFCLDVADPKKRYSVSRFKKDAEKAIRDILKREKVPILCGGTGFYIQAIVDGLILSEVSPNKSLRKELEKLPTNELFRRLKKLDPRRAREIDRHNPHRLVRAIEIASEIGKVPKIKTVCNYDVLQIGINVPDEILKEKIFGRNKKMFQKGLVAEVAKLHKKGVSWKRMKELGFEYHFVAEYLRDKINKGNALCEMDKATWQYAKRQKTWFKRDDRTKWVAFEDVDKTYRLVEKFLQF